MTFPPGDYWTKDDAQHAKEFFASPTWQKMMSVMLLNKPKIDPNKPEHTVTLAAYGRQTWEECLNMFAQFSVPVESAQEDELEQIDTSKF